MHATTEEGSKRGRKLRRLNHLAVADINLKAFVSISAETRGDNNERLSPHLLSSRAGTYPHSFVRTR